ncbi:hypothetical protein ACJX0J_017140, partial [Zea mays]
KELYNESAAVITISVEIDWQAGIIEWDMAHFCGQWHATHLLFFYPSMFLFPAAAISCLMHHHKDTRINMGYSGV